MYFAYYSINGNLFPPPLIINPDSNPCYHMHIPEADPYTSHNDPIHIATAPHVSPISPTVCSVSTISRPARLSLSQPMANPIKFQ